MSIRDHEFKIELLQRCSSSREIYESLDSQVQEYYHECNDDSYAIDNEPYCAQWYIERHVALLSELHEYTRLVKIDAHIPEHLQYITEFWKDIE